MMRKTMMGFALLFMIAGTALAREEARTPAVQRLKEAWSLRRTSFKKKGEEKRKILLETVDRYRSVMQEFPEAKAACAEASFRAGEIYRSLKMTEEAKGAFEGVLRYDTHGPFAARALLELGHIHRRAKAWDPALAFYRRVIAQCPKERDRCADAFTWTGKVLLRKKAYEKARKVLVEFADKFPEFPEDAIRNIDLAAASLLQEGRQAEAQALVEKWRAHFEAMLGKDERMDRRLERALERMKTPERLREAVSKSDPPPAH